MNAIAEQIDVAASLAHADELLASRRTKEAREAYVCVDQQGSHGHDEVANACSAGRWLAAMLDGDFESAWQESDAIRLRGAPDPHRFWNAEDLTGARVIVRCLHGLGDAVQMLRYAPRLAAVASQVIYQVPPRLLPLAPFFRKVDSVITWGESAPQPQWDVQLEIMELPYIFRTRLEQLPLATKYLELPRQALKDAALAMGASTRMRVGLVWTSGEWNPQRSIPFRLLESLLAVDQIEFWNLQGDSAAHQARGLRMKDAAALCGHGLLPLAATIANLDLVITPDTLAAHLAGALGKPAWVLLQHAADWRWMLDREDTPWYPSLRLIRQPVQGDWSSVVERVRDSLQEVTARRLVS